MTINKEFLKKMLNVGGVSAYEQPVRELILQEWEPLVDEISVSQLGSIHGLKKGSKENAKSILIAVHMDAIGLMVSSIKGSFLHISNVGGIDPRVLASQPVRVHTKTGDFPGLIVLPPAHTLPEDIGSSPVPLKHMFVDIGMDEKKVKELVDIGDPISFRNPPQEISDNILIGHTLDNRVSVTAMTKTLRDLQNIRHEWNVWAVASVQEEVGLKGAQTSSFDLQPDLAIAIDVTFAKDSGSADYRSCEMDKGPTLGWGPNAHPKFHEEMKKLAEKLEIPYQIELMPRFSGTDAYALQVSQAGIPTMYCGLPLRYMHTPVEMVHLKDIKRMSRLLTELIASLDDEFMEKISFMHAEEKKD